MMHTQHLVQAFVLSSTLIIRPVRGFSVPAAIARQPRHELQATSSVENNREQSDLFSEEITWAKEQSLHIKPDEKWILKDIMDHDKKSDIERLNNNHHEWFSDATILESTVDRKEQNGVDWFATAIEMFPPIVPLTGKLDKVTTTADATDWFGYAIRTAKEEQHAPVVVTIHPSLQRNSLNEWFSQAMLEQRSPVMQPGNILRSDNSQLDSVVGREWFTNAIPQLDHVSIETHPTNTAKEPNARDHAEWFMSALFD